MQAALNHTLSIFLILLCLSVNSQPNNNNNDSESYLKINDHLIYYKVSGSGSPILLLHGGYLDHSIWEKQTNYLNKNGFMTIAIDDIGHGRTISGTHKVYSYEIIKALITKLKISEVSVVGLSWGCMMAVDFTLAYPEHVDKLVLISPGLNGWEYFQDEKAEENFVMRQLAKTNSDTAQFVEYFQKNWTDGPTCDSLRVKPAIRSQIRDIMMRNMKNHWGAEWSRLAEPPAIERLTEIKVNTLILSGNYDASDILMVADKLSMEIENSTHVKIKNVAHTIQLEKPKQINKIILKFIAKK